MGPAKNGMSTATERHKRQWKCQRCGEWTWLDKDRCHDCNGRRANFESKGGACGGERPQAGPSGKQQAGTKRGGACGGERPQADTEGFVTAGKTRRARRRAKQLETDLAELKERREKDKQQAGSGIEPACREVLPLDDDTKDAVRALRERLKQLQDMPPGLRSLCDSQGGHAKMVADLEQEIQRACAAEREAKPLAAQKVSAEAHLRRVARLHEQATEKLSKTRVQHEQLVKQLAEQEEGAASMGQRVEAARRELADIAEKMAADLRGSPSATTGSAAAATSTVTATAVKGFFQSLPETVSGHPEGQETIQQVMALLDKLDAAAKTATSEAELSRAQARDSSQEAASELAAEDMETDEDVLDQMAEAVVAPAGEGESAEAERMQKVAEAKARLKSSKVFMERGLAKVRKSGAKK